MIDDDRLIDVVGVVLALFVVVALAVIVLAGATAPDRDVGDAPDVDWTVERVSDRHVNITHAGGEPILAADLVVSVAGVERGVGRSDRLTEGEAITVPARPNQEVRLYWVAGRDERVLLGQWQAP